MHEIAGCGALAVPRALWGFESGRAGLAGWYLRVGASLIELEAGVGAGREIGIDD